LTAVPLVLLLAAPARAAMVGSIFSGPTSGDPAAIYWNPGAMPLMRGTKALGFGAISFIRLHHQRLTPSLYDKQMYPQANVFVPKPALALGVVTDATLKDFRFGVGVTLPILDGAGWDDKYGGKEASTRYFALNARLGFIKISPAVAYRISRHISVGVGIDIVGVMLTHEVMTDFGAKINQMACDMNNTQCMVDAPLPREDPSMDALTTIDGFGWGVGVFAGVLISPAPWLRIGAGFHSGAGGVGIPVDMEVKLPSAVTGYVSKNMPSVSLPALTAEGEVTAHSPMIVTAGVAVQPIPKLELSVDLHWIDYSETAVMLGNVTKSSSSLIGDQVLIKDRDDAFLTGLRVSYQFFSWLNTALRFEYENNTRPEQFVTPVSIDFFKYSFHLGVAFKLRWVTLTLEYSHYFLPERSIESSNFAPNADPTTGEEEGFDKPPPTGRYWIEVDRVGFGAMVSF